MNKDKEHIKINIQQIVTKEQKAYEEAVKNMRYTDAKFKISQEGIDTDDLSREQLDKIVELFDQLSIIQRDFNVEIGKIQQEANNKMLTIQNESNKNFADVQTKYREIIDSIKKGTVSNTPDIANVTLSKEREEQIKQELADTLKKATKENT